MPTTWIYRDFQDLIKQPSQTLQLFPIWLLLGPRQVGKSSVLQKCKEPQRQVITLDDLDFRMRANADPALFLKDYPLPLLIDEIQYAPQLLSEIKRRVDKGVAPGSVWLTGSQNFEVMKGVEETLAGRVGIFHLLGLSDQEKPRRAVSTKEYFASVLESTFPKLYSITDLDARAVYLSSYLQTYVERDIRELLGIQKRREFELFLKFCALRTGQVINYDSLAKDAGVSPATAKEWLSLLEDSFLIKLVHPYFSNRSKRLIKSPKLYFLDAGLCAYLAGYRDSEILRFSPFAGALFETHLFGQILRAYQHRAREVQVHFWRDRDGNEIDFLIESSKGVAPVEAKIGSVVKGDLLKLDKIRDPHWSNGLVASLLDLDSTHAPSITRPLISLNEEWSRVTPAQLIEQLCT